MAECKTGATVSRFVRRCCEELCDPNFQAHLEYNIFNPVRCCSTNCSINYASLCGPAVATSTTGQQANNNLIINALLRTPSFVETTGDSERNNIYIPMMSVIIPLVLFIICFSIWRYYKVRNGYLSSNLTSVSGTMNAAEQCKRQEHWFHSPALSFKYFYQAPDQKTPNIESPSSNNEYDKIEGILSEFDDNEWPLNIVNINNILPGTIIGDGHYGMIRKAVFYREGLAGPGIVVALKTMKGDVEGIVNLESQKVMKYCLELELKALQRVGSHPNVIQLIGAVFQPSLIVITEFCEFGDMKNYISKKKLEDKVFMNEITEDEELGSIVEQHLITMSALLMYAFQIANGAEFLSEKTLVHRDLALRNILLTDQHVVKITDFGLVVKGDGYQVQHRRALPTRWLPPESIKPESGTFTPASDVWSFGVALWELFTLGKSPCEDVEAPIKNKAFREWLLRGGRYPQPEFADEKIYTIMKQCWCCIASARPSFEYCKLTFEQMLSKRSPDVHTYIVSKIYR